VTLGRVQDFFPRLFPPKVMGDMGVSQAGLRKTC